MIPKINDLMEMAALLNERYEKTDMSNVVIEFTVSKEMLKRVNEEMFYRNGGNSTFGTPPPSDEVVVNIGKYCFRYVKEEESEEK